MKKTTPRRLSQLLKRKVQGAKLLKGSLKKELHTNEKKRKSMVLCKCSCSIRSCFERMTTAKVVKGFYTRVSPSAGWFLEAKSLSMEKQTVALGPLGIRRLIHVSENPSFLVTGST